MAHRATKRPFSYSVSRGTAPLSRSAVSRPNDDSLQPHSAEFLARLLAVAIRRSGCHSSCHIRLVDPVGIGLSARRCRLHIPVSRHRRVRRLGSLHFGGGRIRGSLRPPATKSPLTGRRRDGRAPRRLRAFRRLHAGAICRRNRHFPDRRSCSTSRRVAGCLALHGASFLASRTSRPAGSTASPGPSSRRGPERRRDRLLESQMNRLRLAPNLLPKSQKELFAKVAFPAFAENWR